MIASVGSGEREAPRVREGWCEVHDASGAFEQKNIALRMENCTAFIRACRKLGVLEKDLFSTVDLYAAVLED